MITVLLIVLVAALLALAIDFGLDDHPRLALASSVAATVPLAIAVCDLRAELADLLVLGWILLVEASVILSFLRRPLLATLCFVISFAVSCAAVSAGRDRIRRHAEERAWELRVIDWEIERRHLRCRGRCGTELRELYARRAALIGGGRGRAWNAWNAWNAIGRVLTTPIECYRDRAQLWCSPRPLDDGRVRWLVCRPDEGCGVEVHGTPRAGGGW